MKLPATAALLVSFLTSICISGAYAQTHTQGVPNGQHRVNAGGACTSITTPLRPIKGWEQDLTTAKPNLKHYCWVPMLEAGRQYRRVAPGQTQLKGITHYPKPRVAAVPTHATYPKLKKIFVPVQHHSGIYVRPKHVPTVRPSVNTQIALAAPKTRAQLAAPRTNLQWSNPNTNVQLISHNPRGGIYVKPRHVPTVRPQLTSTNTNIALAAPRINGQLASRQAIPQLATRQTIARLANQEVTGQLAAPDTAVELSYDNSGGIIAQRQVYGNVQSSRVKGHVLLPTKAY